MLAQLRTSDNSEYTRPLWVVCVQMIGLGAALTAHPHIDPPTADRGARMAIWKWQRCGACSYPARVVYDVDLGTMRWSAAVLSP